MQESLAVFMLEKNFEGESVMDLGNCLNANDVNVVVVSSRKGVLADSNQEIQVAAEASYVKTNPEQPDVFVIIDQNSPEKLLESNSAQKLIRDADYSNKLIVAVQNGVGVLADAGVLRGKKVTCPNNDMGKVRNSGAEITNNDIEVDGNIITAKSVDSLAKLCNVITKQLQAKAA